jgi:hypothetical protein
MPNEHFVNARPHKRNDFPSSHRSSSTQYSKYHWVLFTAQYMWRLMQSAQDNHNPVLARFAEYYRSVDHKECASMLSSSLLYANAFTGSPSFHLTKSYFNSKLRVCLNASSPKTHIKRVQYECPNERTINCSSK